MNSDSSKLFYDKYFELENRNIKLIIDNDKELTGQIVGFFKGDEENGEPYIIKWHFVEANIKMLWFDAEDVFVGELIYHSKIKIIQLEQDNSIIQFKK